MVREIALEQVALNLQAAVSDVRDGHNQLVIIYQGKPVLAMIPFEAYQRWFAEREKAFQYLDELPTRNLPYSEGEVEADVEQAIHEVRTEYTDK